MIPLHESGVHEFSILVPFVIILTHQVTVVGDGRSTPVTMAGDKLWSVDALVKVGGDVPLPGLIKDTHKKLSKNVFE